MQSVRLDYNLHIFRHLGLKQVDPPLLLEEFLDLFIVFSGSVENWLFSAKNTQSAVHDAVIVEIRNESAIL